MPFEMRRSRASKLLLISKNCLFYIDIAIGRDSGNQVKYSNLQKLSVDQLLALREHLNKAIGERLADERRALAKRMAQLDAFNSGSGIAPQSTLLPKFRNPQNPAQTWAGRGLQPRWLVAELKQGRKLEDFRIKAKSAGKKPRKRRRSSNAN
jgi:DNA-binding protein H-NS